jgi:OOP family OmpA-OmpF porin
LSGRVTATTFGANLWYDLHSPVAPVSRWHPYFGAGLLGVHEQYHGMGTTDNAGRILFGYQAGAGIGFELTPSLCASVDYRFMLITRGNYQLDSVGATTDAAFRYRAQSAMLSLRYAFLRAPPPEMPTPPADPTRVVPVVPDNGGADAAPAPSGGDSGAPPPQ